MGKVAIVVGFFLCIGLAGYAFVNRKATSPRDLAEGAPTVVPRMMIQGLTAKRYDGNRLDAELTAAVGELFEPNLVKLHGNVRAFRYRGPQKQAVVAERVYALMNAKSFAEMFGGPDLVRAELHDKVRASFSDAMLVTSFAEYTAADELLSSTREVRWESRNRWFTGDQGFRYDLSSENIEIFGAIKGAVKPGDES